MIVRLYCCAERGFQAPCHIEELGGAVRNQHLHHLVDSRGRRWVRGLGQHHELY